MTANTQSIFNRFGVTSRAGIPVPTFWRQAESPRVAWHVALQFVVEQI
jgi:hypothetical protein